ncbi:MAG: HAMP domain-containing sensor histidine kinase [Isosphaeraceae bacterium]
MEMRPDSLTDRIEAETNVTTAIDPGALRALLSSLSHELCRPLVSLRAGFDLLLHDPASAVSDDQRVHLQTMRVLCDDLLRLTRGYLDYAGMVNGSRNPTLGVFSLGAVIGEIDRQFRPQAESHGLSWSAIVDDPRAKVMTDASLCQQIVGNLASNAIKYTPSGGRIRIDASVGDSGWMVTVSDDGPGIPADSLDRVFEPFFRLARDEHSRIEGNGLGLSICRELTERLGGTISLDSTGGTGTLVRVWFPLIPPAADACDAAENEICTEGPVPCGSARPGRSPARRRASSRSTS